MLLMIFLSCSDFGIFKPADVYGPDDAKISVPLELDVGIVCGGEPAQIEIRNEGVYPLAIEALPSLEEVGCWIHLRKIFLE